MSVYKCWGEVCVMMNMVNQSINESEINKPVDISSYSTSDLMMI